MFCWRGHLTKIKLVTFNEFVTLTFFIDLCKKPTIGNAQIEEHNDKLSQTFSRLKEELDTANECTPKGKTNGNIRAISDYLTNTIWDEFEEVFLQSTGRFLESGVAGKDSLEPFDNELGSEVFADARAAILLVGREAEIHRPKTEREPSQGDGVLEFKETQQHAALKRVSPFIQEWSGGADIANKLEFTCSTMIDNRYIVVTSMGSQTPYGKAKLNIQEDGKYERLKYLVFLNGLAEDSIPGINRWQVGRLIQRINNIGTLRFAAIRDLKEIRAASQALVSLGRQLDDISSATPNEYSVASAHKQLGVIFQRLAQTSGSVPYGLAYRIAHSRQSVKELKKILEDLRVQRIPGWQPYNEFLRRRLFSVFDSIDAVGRRSEVIRDRANSFLNQIYATKLMEYQKAADILVYVGGTYYLGSVFYYIFSPIFKSMKVVSPLGGLVGPETDGLKAVCFIVAFGTIFVVKKYPR